MEILKCGYFKQVDMGFFKRIRGFVSPVQSDSDFISPVRSDPGFVSPIRSDPIRFDPLQSWFNQQPIKSESRARGMKTGETALQAPPFICKLNCNSIVLTDI